MSFDDESHRAEESPTYQVISVNIGVGDAVWLDTVRERLRRSGLTKSTRSEIVRLAVALLKSRLEGLTDGELVNCFLNRRPSGSDRRDGP